MTAPALFARTWGQGPPVVLLHGLGASSRYWESLAEASSGYAAVAPDLLGFGRSPKPPHASYDVACHLGALAALPAGPAVVVGHFAGAILAAALAAACPRAVRALLLLGLPAFADEATARREVGRLGLLARLTVDGNPLAGRLCIAMCRLRPLAPAIAPVLMRDLPPSVAADGALHTWASYHRTLEGVVLAHRVADDLRTATVPVILLHGERDRTAPVHHVRALTGQVRVAGGRAELQVVDGDHHLAVRQPAPVARALAQLLGAPPSSPDQGAADG